MPTDDDKKSAWIRFEGEAKRLLIRRPRISHQALLFGPRAAARTVALTSAELAALIDGRTLAIDDGEHILYLSVDAATVDEARRMNSSVAVAEAPPRYSERVRVRAAQVRVNADRRARPRAVTPAWIVELARRST